MDRLTVAEAAEQLGVTQDAVRQRIRRNTIEHERTEDGRVYVYLTEDDAKVDDVHHAVQKAVIERLEGENEFLRRELERKDHLLAAALERIPPQLEAPPQPRESPEPVAEGGGTGDVHKEEGRPWWRRLFGA